MQICPNCNEPISSRLLVCPLCGHTIKEMEEEVIDTLPAPSRPTQVVKSLSDRPGFVNVIAILTGLSGVLQAIGAVALMFSDGLDPGRQFWGGLRLLGLAIFTFMVTWGLWQRRNWARILVIISQGLAVLNCYADRNFVSFILMPVSIYIIYWLIKHDNIFHDRPRDSISMSRYNKYDD